MNTTEKEVNSFLDYLKEELSLRASSIKENKEFSEKVNVAAFKAICDAQGNENGGNIEALSKEFFALKNPETNKYDGLGQSTKVEIKSATMCLDSNTIFASKPKNALERMVRSSKKKELLASRFISGDVKESPKLSNNLAQIKVELFDYLLVASCFKEGIEGYLLTNQEVAHDLMKDLTVGKQHAEDKEANGRQYQIDSMSKIEHLRQTYYVGRMNYADILRSIYNDEEIKAAFEIK